MTLYARFRAESRSRDRLVETFKELYTGAAGAVSSSVFSVAASWSQIPTRVRRDALSVSIEGATR